MADIREPIDIVYCWCDGSDPEFKARKNKYLANREQNDDIGDLRFWDNNELKYSLRSLEKNLSWVHHIYLVNNGSNCTIRIYRQT